MAEAQTVETPKAPAVQTGGGKSATVMVACKLPAGLWADLREEGPDGYTNRIKARIFLKGSAKLRRLERADDKGNPIDVEGLPDVAGGFGLTEVPADFWEAWLKQNRDYAPVRAGVIFASKDIGRGRGEATEKAEVRSGMEPIDPAKKNGGLKSGEGVVTVETLERG